MFLVAIAVPLITDAAPTHGKLATTWGQIKGEGGGVGAVPKAPRGGSGASSGEAEAAISAMLNDINAQLGTDGRDYRVGVAEYLTLAESGEVGTTVFAGDVGNKQLSQHFVPGDSRRAWSTPPGINYAVDQVDGTATPGLSATTTTAAIDRAMGTWNGAQCSTIPVVKGSDFGLDLGVVEFSFTGGASGNQFIVADIHHAGWGSIDFALPSFVIGVTFTFIFIDTFGNPTDIDNNGKLDTAFREIYYNDTFSWAINGNIDVESVALHEAGHGLSQAHFGKIFLTNANGKLHFAPRAVMNAAYSGVQQSLAGTDNGGHCSIWASWPNR